MGILNVTPDSFSDGGRFAGGERAIEHACSMVDDGADIIDVGGESTRPGAQPVAEREELDRIVPVIEALMPELARRSVPLSVDTRQTGVMRAAIAAGASMINDVAALRAPGAIDAVRRSDAAVCLMHMQGDPSTMQIAPTYVDVVAEVRAFLAERADACVQAGIARERIVIDPGFGFGKTRAHNVELLRGLPELASLGFPVLVGLSRKSAIGALTKRDVGDRLAGSLAAALAAVARGAAIVRVHDVRETVDALKVWAAAGSRAAS